MNNCRLPLTDSTSSLTLRALESYAEQWLLSCEIAQHSEATLANRRLYVKNLLWFLRRYKHETCDVEELRAFFAYLSNKKPDPGGRWGNPQETKPVKSSTVLTYYQHIRTLFNFIVAEGGLTVSPMQRIVRPTDRPDDILPFTSQQVEQLLAAAKRSRQPRRDEALLWFLFDTGVRVGELSALCFSDLDMSARRAQVEGKGGKKRPVPFGKTTAKALWAYLNIDGRNNNEPLFLSERGDALTDSGIQKILRRLGKEAGIAVTRCSPHTFRHTFAVTFLRNGGNQFTLMQILGHTSLAMTARYVKLASADIEAQHREYSPADSLKKGKKR